MFSIVKLTHWIRRKLFGTITKPNNKSYESLFYEGFLELTSNINNKDVLVCYNFVILYLNRILNINLDKINVDLGDNLDLKSLSIGIFRNLFENINDKIYEIDKLEENTIIFYENSTGNVVHVGFVVKIFQRFWIISKFGTGPLFLHLPNKVPHNYGTPKYFFKISDEKYQKKILKINHQLEIQIDKMKKIGLV